MAIGADLDPGIVGDCGEFCDCMLRIYGGSFDYFNNCYTVLLLAVVTNVGITPVSSKATTRWFGVSPKSGI
jgi:hypothetical protein